MISHLFSRGDHGGLSKDAIALARLITTPLFMLDAEGKVVVWNAACERLTGLSAAAVEGATEHWRAFYSEPTPCLADLVLSGEMTLDRDGGLTGTQQWFDLPNAGRKYLHIEVAVLRDPHGAVVAAVQTLNDKTDELTAKTELAAKSAELDLFQEEQAVVVEGLATHLRALAEGNLATDIETFFPERYKRLRMDFNAAVRHLSRTMRDIRCTSEEVANAANELAFSADVLSQKSASQASTLQQTAQAHDQITATVRRSLALAQEASDLAGGACAKGDGARAIVSQATEAIRSIEAQSRQITQIVGVIDEIAFQTNLLALNAGVEAARAGDAGRGFAVVALEVRALAQRSASAAKQIAQLINTTADAVRNGVAHVDRTGACLYDMVDQLTIIAERVQGISLASEEQTRGLEDINQAICELDAGTQANAHVAVQTADASGKLTEQSMVLSDTVRKFDLADHVTPTTAVDSKQHDIDALWDAA